MSEPAAEILTAVREAIGGGSRELQRPALLDSDFGQIASAATVGSLEAIEAFEASLCAHTGASHSVAISSGTAALHLALMAAGVKAGEEVLCPTLTFAATANAIVHAGAIPHFIDSDVYGARSFKLRQYLGLQGFERTLNGCINLATRRKVAAIVPVHLLGIPCEINALHNIATSYGIMVIEDAAEALGSRTPSDEHCGTIGVAGVLSFNMNKIITTGGGGAVLTNDEAMAKRIRHLSSQAKVAHPFLWQHDEIGWNYRMPPPCAAVGIPQMMRLKQTLEAKADLAARYTLAFADAEHAALIAAPGNNWINAIMLDPRCMDKRDEVLGALQADGFEARAMFTPLHLLPHLRHYPRMDSMGYAEDSFRRCICLPSTVL